MATTLRTPASPARLFPTVRMVPAFPAVVGTLLGAPRPTSSRKARRTAPRLRARVGLEAMEGRQLMSNVPVFATASYGGWSPVAVSVSPMESSQVTGSISCVSTTASPASVQLTAGELLTASVDMTQVSNGAQTYSSLTVKGPNGTAAYASTLSEVQSTNPDTGAATDDSFVTFTAPTTGTYTFGVGGAFINNSFDDYTLSIRPITLDSSTLNPEANTQDAAKLSFSGGGLYAFLNVNDTVLTLDGPTGRGFQVTGTFTEKTTSAGTGLTTSTITSTGSSITLDSGLGNINIPTSSKTPLVVTTQANGYNGAFGQVNTANIQFPGSSIVSDLVDPLGALGISNLSSLLTSNNTGVNLTTPGIEYGISLGQNLPSTITSAGAPVNNAVPYLYLCVNTGASVSVGQVQGSIDGKAASVVVDPADPFAYVDIQGLPVVSDGQFAISEHGYIPFTASETPDHFSGTLYGDVYVGGTISLADLTDDVIPLDVSGSMVLNFAANGGSWTSAINNDVRTFFQDVQDAVENPSWHLTLSEAESLLNSVAFGVNGTLSLDLSAEEVFSLTVPLFESSAIWNGPSGMLYYHGETANPLVGTDLSFLDNNSLLSIDGYVSESGSFDLDLTGSYGIGDFSVQGGLDVSSTGIAATGTLSTGVGTATVSGELDWNGNYSLIGTVDVGFSGAVGCESCGMYLDGGLSADLGIFISGSTSNTSATIYGGGSIYGEAMAFGVDTGYIDEYGAFCVTTSSDFSISSFVDEAWDDVESIFDDVVGAWYDVEDDIEDGYNDVVNFFESL